MIIGRSIKRNTDQHTKEKWEMKDTAVRGIQDLKKSML